VCPSTRTAFPFDPMREPPIAILAMAPRRVKANFEVLIVEPPFRNSSRTQFSGERVLTMPQDVASDTREVGREFATRSERHGENDLFVANNLATLKERGILGAAVPAERGGGDAVHRDLAEMLRMLAHWCGSTALVLSMDTHQVANAWCGAGATVPRRSRCYPLPFPVRSKPGVGKPDGPSRLAGSNLLPPPNGPPTLNVSVDRFRPVDHPVSGSSSVDDEAAMDATDLSLWKAHRAACLEQLVRFRDQPVPRIAKKLKPQQGRAVIPSRRSLIRYLSLPF